MSIATSLSALQQAKTDIATAITNKGGTVNQGDGMSDFATDIGTIPTGSDPVIQSKTITANGTYTAPEGVDGYSPVTVNTDPAKGFVFNEWDSDGYPTSCKFCGTWQKTPERFLVYGSGDDSTYSLGRLSKIEFDTVYEIGSISFRQLPSLTSFTIPNTVTKIGQNAFWELPLNSISIPASVVQLSVDSFRSCGLKKVVFEGQAPHIPRYCFEGCNNIEEYDFSHCTTIPTLENGTNCFYFKSGCICKVPQALLSEWQVATNWNNYAFTYVGV